MVGLYFASLALSWLCRIVVLARVACAALARLMRGTFVPVPEMIVHVYVRFRECTECAPCAMKC